MEPPEGYPKPWAREAEPEPDVADDARPAEAASEPEPVEAAADDAPPAG